MRELSVLALLALVSATELAAQSGDVPPIVKSLVNAERAFSRASIENGMRSAFLEYLTADAIIFRPRPVEGRRWYEERENPAGTLRWEPVFAVSAAAGDMGWTTGPWEFEAEGAGGPSVTYGHYVSVWKKQPSGAWRVVIDGGIVHPSPATSVAEATLDGYRRLAAFSETRPDLGAERALLLTWDHSFSTATTEDGFRAAFTHFASADVRVYRMGGLPLVGKGGAAAGLTGAQLPASWEPMAADVSESGDLGYTYGVAKAEAEGAEDASSYLRIWQREPGGDWLLALEITNPIPSGSGQD